MELTIGHTQALIAQSNKLNDNPQVEIMGDQVSYLIIPFEGNIKDGYPQGLTLHLKSTEDV